MQYVKLLLLIFIPVLLAAQECKVVFAVTARGVAGDEAVYIAGNHHKLGSWHPGKTELTREGAGAFTAVCTFPAGTELEFKFTKGSWDKQALFREGEIPGNFHCTVYQDTVIAVSIPMWQKGAVVTGKVTGTVRAMKNIGADGLLPRDIWVWLPPGYDSSGAVRYPVLYMHDGQNVFDPATSTLGIDWGLDEAADSLIRAGTIAPVIIVAVGNTEDRGHEYQNSGTGYLYARFLVETLKPIIDSLYPTNPAPAATVNGGASLAGLMALLLPWEYSYAFGGGACLSPAFHIGNIDYVSSVRASAAPQLPVRIFIYNGGVALENQLQPGVNEMLDVLAAKGYTPGSNMLYIRDTAAVHNEAAWGKQAAALLTFFFGK